MNCSPEVTLSNFRIYFPRLLHGISSDIKTNVGRIYRGPIKFARFLDMDFSVVGWYTWIVNIIDSIMIMILVSLVDKIRVTIFDLWSK